MSFADQSGGPAHCVVILGEDNATQVQSRLFSEIVQHRIAFGVFLSVKGFKNSLYMTGFVIH